MSSLETNDLAAVVEALRSHDRFLVTTHENPDGDALGSLLAAKLGLEQLGKDVAMTLYSDAPLPGEYAFMALEGLRRDWPEDADTRVLLAVDCANATRIVDELDVSAIARRSGGGGHRQAAGFSSDASVEEITDFVRREFAASGRSAA